MPTPVSVARQCLTPESAHALDEAVSVARRRGHAQTTSLHAISALLSLPSSSLREACSRARNAAYSPRLQFKALELCLSVSLDRVPSSQLTDEPPPVSNSLMAAIKRSQANQRRQPENFHLYHQLSNQSSSINAVKVELQHLILSILDDPVVSRVFGEAGFRSSEIKMAIIRPLPHLFRYANRPRLGSPVFLCNLADPGGVGFINRDGFGPAKQQRGFNFPFSVGVPDAVDENCRRIGEVLGRVKGRNPMLVGVCAYDALKRFLETLEKREDRCHGGGTGTGFLPAEIKGVQVFNLESEMGKLVEESENSLDGKFEELGEFVRERSGSACLICIGNLRSFVEDSGVDRVRSVVDQLTRLLEVNSGKVWLIGAVGSHDVYAKFSSKFPTVEKDWDLCLLPITSHRPAVAESWPKSSLMESFVPFAGFFSTSSDLNGPLIRSPYESMSQYNLSREKWEPEAVGASKGGFATSVADKYQHSLPSWMQMAEMGKKESSEKNKDDELVQSTKSSGLQKELDGDCQQSRLLLMDNNVNQLQPVVGFQYADEKRKTGDYQSNFKTDASPYETGCRSVNSSTSTESQQFSSSPFGIHLPRTSSSRKESFLSKLLEKPSDTEDANSTALGSPNCSGSSLSLDGSRTSPASTTSAMTILGLGLHCPPEITELNKDAFQNRGPCSTTCDLFTKSISKHLIQPSPISTPGRSGQSTFGDFKELYSALRRRIDWQDEAINIICKTIVERQTNNEKRQPARDIWFTFMGPDKIGKRKVAVALSEILYGSREHFVYIDLSSQDGLFNLGHSFDPRMNGYDLNYRGKTTVDVIAGELSKKPMSIMFLENVDKADEQVQSSLFEAVSTGKFSDSHGRRVGVNNTIFVTTTSFIMENHVLSLRKDGAKYSEEAVLGAKCSPMMILVEAALKDTAMIHNMPKSVKFTSASSSHVHMNKRKLATSNENVEFCETSEVTKKANKRSGVHFDLNLPADSDELLGSDNETISDDVISDNSQAWLLGFIDLIMATVVFKPYDFDSLAEKILKEIKESFRKNVGSECILEIDSKVMEQLLSAAFASDGDRVWEDWMVQVLSKEFSEIQRRYMLTPQSIVRLLSRDCGSLEEQPSRTVLPSRITLTDIHE